MLAAKGIITISSDQYMAQDIGRGNAPSQKNMHCVEPSKEKPLKIGIPELNGDRVEKKNPNNYSRRNKASATRKPSSQQRSDHRDEAISFGGENFK